MSLGLLAVCTSCGFSDSVEFGCRMAGPRFYGPAANLRTKKLTTVTYDEYSLTKNVRFYTDPTMYKGDIEECPIEFAGVSIKANDNYCPKCKAFTLTFDLELLID